MEHDARATGDSVPSCRRAVFLDRDGVINRVIQREGRPYPPSCLAEFHYLPGVDEAVLALHKAGFCLIIVTNQPDVAKGVQTRKEVESMHERIRRDLPIDDIKVCYHVDEDACSCRKPKPGMLQEAAQQWHINLDQSYMVGDRWRDMEAGKAAGCKTILVSSSYQEKQAENPDAAVASLLEASMLILSQRV